MAIQTFTAGQVLTAAQMNSLQANDYNQTTTTQTNDYTLVLADRGTREVANKGTAITFTVPNSVFSAGDTVQIHNIGAGTLTIAAGIGATVNGAAGLTLAQYQGGTLYFTSTSSSIFFATDKTVTTPGLVRISGQTTFTSVANFTIDNVFTSTYQNYLILIRATATTNVAAFWALRTGGTTAATNYNSQELTGNGTTVSGNRLTSQTSAQATAIGTVQTLIRLELSGPQLAAATTGIAHASYGASGGIINRTDAGQHTTATSYDGLDFSCSGTMSGNYTIYGYATS